MKRLFSGIILILFLSYPAWTDTVRVPEIDARFELTLKALIARIELNNYYEQTRQYHRLNYVVDMQEEVVGQPFFENVNLVEKKLEEVHRSGDFDVYVIVSIPYAPDINETEEEIELYKRRFTEALYSKGYTEKAAGKGIILNIDGTIRQRSKDKKLITAYTAYVGFGNSLSNETIRQGVETLKDFNYFIGRTTSKTQAGIQLVDKVYNAFTENPNMDFQSSEYILVYSAESEWKEIYGKQLSDPQPHDAIILPTPYGTIEDYSGVLYSQLDQDFIEDLSDRIVKSNNLLDKPKFQVFITTDYHLKNSRSALQLLYDYKSKVDDDEVVLAFHFREVAGRIEVQYEILIGEDYVYPEQKIKIAETFILPFLTSGVSFGQILQETLFVSLEYASAMGKLATSFEKSNVPREWWDNDRYFFCLSPETAGVIDGCLEVAGGAIHIGEFGIDMAGTMVDFVSDGKIAKELQDEVGEMLYITLNGLAAYASLTDQEKEEILNEIQGQITKEVSDYFDLLKSGTREGRYESAKLAFNVISTFVGVTELKILLKTGSWPAATAIKIKDLKNAFQGANRKESIKSLLQSIKRIKLSRVGTNSAFKVGDKIANISIKQIRQGSNGKVAVIGRKMYGHVEEVASALKNDGIDVEIFSKEYQQKSIFEIDGKKLRWDDLQEDFSDLTKYKRDSKGYIIDSDIPKTLMYKANKQWAENLVNQGYKVFDVGCPTCVTTESLFYNMELDIIF